MKEYIEKQQAIDALLGITAMRNTIPLGSAIFNIKKLPSAQPERKTGHWILDRSGKYCCSKCMEPCAGYVMMRPRDKFCKMCGSRNEVTE